MEQNKLQIIESLVVIFGYIITHFLTKFYVNATLKQTKLQRGRRKMIIKVLQLLSFLTATILLAAIWGLKQNEIMVFVSTILTALGIAFFAQWSLLSNVTSSLLIFFNHPLKIGDKIKVLDKDFPFEGEIVELTYFFVHIKAENGAITTIPNSLLFQKAVTVIDTKTPQNNS